MAKTPYSFLERMSRPAHLILLSAKCAGKAPWKNWIRNVPRLAVTAQTNTYLAFFFHTVENLVIGQLYKLLVDLASVCLQVVEEALLVDLLPVVVVRLLELVSGGVKAR